MKLSGWLWKITAKVLNVIDMLLYKDKVSVILKVGFCGFIVCNGLILKIRYRFLEILVENFHILEI